jgi:hypothetical protein
MLRGETPRAAQQPTASAWPSETPRPDPLSRSQARRALVLCVLLVMLAASIGHCLSALDAL